MADTTNRHLYPGIQKYPRNQWYVASFAEDIGRTPIARILLDVPVVLYRTESGEAIALYDRCPHKGLPLSVGKLIGDRLQCGYHGIEFGTDGRAVHIPQQPHIAPSMCARRFPLIEQGPLVWIWMGDTDKADPALLPDASWMKLDAPGYVAIPYHWYELEANYQFMHDNLQDITHVSYLHAGLIDAGDFAATDFETRQEGQLLTASRTIRGTILNEGPAQRYRADPTRRYDFTLSAETFVPSICVGRSRLDDVDDPSRAPLEFLVLNAVTPRSRTQSYHFHVRVAPYEHGSERDIEQTRTILQQDKDASELLQERYELFGDAGEVSIISDKPQILCRRMIDRLVSAEEEARVLETV